MPACARPLLFEAAPATGADETLDEAFADDGLGQPLLERVLELGHRRMILEKAQGGKRRLTGRGAVRSVQLVPGRAQDMNHRWVVAASLVFVLGVTVEAARRRLEDVRGGSASGWNGPASIREQQGRLGLRAGEAELARVPRTAPSRMILAQGSEARGDVVDIEPADGGRNVLVE